MVIEVRLYAGLKKYAPSSSSGILAVDVSESILVEELLEELEIAASEVGSIKINGNAGSARQTLQDGDRVDLLPASGLIS
ncbi:MULTISPECIES: MoaD/ThiS family protein [Propionispora]|jgi:molybdopterin synthase sulfur carrier subunit|uniref:Mut7-C ubiquitin n=2 Tax=Propionispora TaxID=112902 RepID=A0A1H8XU10_9FIRM|nr:MULTISPECIES: MoaD/ThiS family protein [Propionispora]SEP43514.1 Mut7-C ubiquitin [Propionispora vibrioides]SHJ51312.1 Mut7-C ubiquitin [Propionispora hippei DSM 15287]